MEIISREEARGAGLKRFYTGAACPRGHISERYVNNGHCIECRKRFYDPVASKEYNRIYRQENLERIALQDKERKAKAYALKRRDARAQKAAYQSQLIAERTQRKMFNRKLAVERVRLWGLSNPGKKQSKRAKRRAIKMRAVPSWFGELDAFVWLEAADLVIRRNALTGIGWHADHMIPLAAREACGLHVASNCQVIPQRLNNQKHCKMILAEPGEWIAHL